MTTDLHFHESPISDPSSDLRIVFGAPLVGAGDTLGTLGISLAEAPTVSVAGVVRELEPGTVAVSLGDAPAVAVAGILDNAVSRGPRSSTTAEWRGAAPAPISSSAAWTAPVRAPRLVAAPITDAPRLPDTPVAAAWEESARFQQSRQSGWSEAQRLPATSARAPFDEAVRVRKQRTSRWQEGAQVEGQQVRMPYQETTRTRRSASVPFQEAVPKRRQVTSRIHDALGLVRDWVVPWEEGRHPLPGRSVITPPPVIPDLCYTPPAGSAVPLVFSTTWDGSTELTFVCDNHPTLPGGTVVVPIQEVYMISNDVSLVLASDGTVIPTISFSLSLDYKSWAWSFTAQVPRAALAVFDMDAGGDPKVLTATVNGTAFGVIAESVVSDRQFNTGNLTITGRGLIAGLADPYAPTLTFGNAEDRTAQQIVADVLTNNGVSLGWAVDWQMTDWLVPAGAWAFQGTYMTAVQAIAAAAGGYVQPTANDQTVRVLPLFPAAPWDWSGLTVDYEIPAAVMTQEGITWSDLPAYNRVFVSGTNSSGVLGDVTRAGTAGDFEKPMVTDQLITHADAARQRGVAELSVGGRSAVVALKTLVLPSTGVILPGKIVDYVDGAKTRRGIVRSVRVDVAYPTVYQTIGVETYV